MEEWIKNLRVEDLESPYDVIAEELGLEVAFVIEKLFRGQQVYFPSFKKANATRIKEMILEEFDGYNYTKLARKYGFTERHIRSICSKHEEQAKSKQLDGQLDMFDP